MPPSPKKSGAAKAKGAVRAKSGCYTCRIRRKKCDEKPNGEGHCETCVRLKLECLGFGAKRPDWLRDNRNVLDLREKIKSHLAAQGMIKGHSGAAPRSAEHEPVVLRLHLDYNSSASPPTPTLALDEHRPHGLTTSSIRDDDRFNPLAFTPGLSPDSPRVPPDYHHDIMLPPYQPVPSHNLVPWSSNQPTITYYNPGGRSTFGSMYSEQVLEDEYESSLVSTAEMYQQPTYYNFSRPIYTPRDEQLLGHYLNKVFDIQYLLADPKIRILMRSTIEQSETARHGAYLLSMVHQSRTYSNGAYNGNFNEEYTKVVNMLLPTAPLPIRAYSAGDAMAGLHVVSAILFNGGTGDWASFIDVACHFCDGVLRDRQYNGPAEALMYCNDTTRFIIKTTMWFDVLGAASRLSAPYFLHTYRELFDPRGASFDGPPPEELCMLPVMGCENHVFWALAEICTLASWKVERLAQGRFSGRELHEKLSAIEQVLLRPSRPSRVMPHAHAEQEIGERRRLTSEIFRFSALVYLHWVLSGDSPGCAEIKENVGMTITCLKEAVERHSRVFARGVVRSVVFSIYICGCLTDDLAQREFLRERLMAEQSETVGNCKEVRELMESVWEARRKGNPHLHWREALQKSKILLV